jgi:hypothetical protein
MPSLSPATKHFVTLLAAGTAIVTLFLLAASLANLEFHPGEVFVMPERLSIEQVAPGKLFTIPPQILTIVMIVFACMLAIALVIIWRSPKARRVLLKFIGQILLFLLIYIVVTRLYTTEQTYEPLPTESTPLTQKIEAPPEDLGEPIPTEPFIPPSPPPWLTYLSTLLIILVVGAAGYWIWRFTHPPKMKLGEIARVAVQDLHAGRSWEDIVIQAYADMSTTISRRRGIDRHQTMTASEFARRLQQAGLPAAPVQKLTRLFEKARYGSYKSSQDEGHEALDCLSAIMQAVERRQ